MSALHVGILLAFAACSGWSAHALVAVAREVSRENRALRLESSARRSDADPAAAQDQRERL